MAADVALRMDSTAGGGALANSVATLPISMQVAFRRKLFGLLLLNLLTVLLIMIIVVHIPGLLDLIDSNLWVPFFCLVSWAVSLIMMSMFKESYPANYCWLLIFTLALGGFLGLGHRAFNCHFNFQIVANACVTIAVFQFLITRTTFREGIQTQLLTFRSSAIIAYLTSLCIAIIVQVTWLNSFDRLRTQTERTTVLVIVQIFAFLTIFWFSYDTYSIEKRLPMDEYMMAIICFYTDFVSIVMCCCCAACCLGGS